MVRVSGLTDSVVSVEVEFRHSFKRGAFIADIAISVLLAAVDAEATMLD